MMKIFLRPVTEKDCANIVKWRNSEKVKSHCLTKTPITEESNLKFFRDNIATGKYKQFIVERIEEEIGLASYPIATVYLKDLDCENHRCELCVFTSDDVEWNAEGQSIAIKMLLEKAFSEFGMHKVYSYVFNKYNDELELLKSTGFSVESILKEEAINENGDYEDIVRLCCYNC
jgi:RimJ/RimL family protein N-acetyltransferase